MGSPNRKIDSTSLIEELYPKVERIVRGIARSYSIPPSQIDDLISAGYLGLVEAAENFDPNHEVPFAQFAQIRIRGAVIDSMRKNSRVSGSSYQMRKALDASQALREEELDREGVQKSVENSSTEGQETPKKKGGKRDRKTRIARLLDFAAKGALAYGLSYEGLLDCGEEFIDESNTSVEEEIDQKRHIIALREGLSNLEDHERNVLEDYYFHDLSFEEIATKCGKESRTWAWRVHGRALKKLQKIMMSMNSPNGEEDDSEMEEYSDDEAKEY